MAQIDLIYFNLIKNFLQQNQRFQSSPHLYRGRFLHVLKALSEVAETIRFARCFRGFSELSPVSGKSRLQTAALLSK